MEMEDHHRQYGLSDLRQLINGRPTTHFQPIPQVSELFSGHRNLLPQPHHHLEMMQMVGTRQMSDLLPLGLHEIPVESSANAATAAVAVTSASTPSSVNGFDGEGGGFGGDGGTGRWPRQETLTLLEIRSRLDPKFKEANQKGPLWDEVSRIMSEEHGYQRTGKKCREKFENLYKYYKKTKEGKAGRQDGKHYRFFRQLEALYGDTSSSVPIPESDHLIGTSFRFHGNPNSNSSTQEGYHSQKLCDSLSLSNNSSDFHTSSSDDNDLSTAAGMENDSRKRRRSGRSWKVKIKEFIDVQMRKLMERQEAWLERLTKTLEQKEQERMLREEEWRKQEAERIDREHKFWAKERAWIEARDAALMEALQTLNGRQVKASSPEELMVGEVQNHSENQNENGSEIMNNSGKEDGWGEAEITRLIQLRSSMKLRFDQSGGCSEEILWEEIASKLACLGYEKSGSMCKEKWDEINNFLKKKKSKEFSISGPYYSNNESIYNPTGGGYCEINDQAGTSPPNSNIGNAVNDSCFRFLMTDGENLWENYGLKLNKGENQ
ncbi:hypothetical protein SLEP1_g45564 [Rubroshorea leprosula]|uniref:Myb-like domain-containing protein n=1 Tax=Rubroshorea leprosula TaxID=152421 RepID=A0AAV5LM06_9ROSI|nr:hypothetical protein SLEP1_g45564 [Rubroshorea leprosula]